MQSNSSSFSTFLRNVQPPVSSSSPVELDVFPSRLLMPLIQGPLEVERLRKSSALGVLEFADALRKMHAAELIEISTEGEHEVVSLTPAGRRVADALGSK